MRIVQLCQVLQTKEKGAEIGVCCMHPTSKGFFYLELKITKANKKKQAWEIQRIDFIAIFAKYIEIHILNLLFIGYHAVRH